MANSCNNLQNPVDYPEAEEETYDLLYHFAKACKAAGTLSCAVSVLTSKTEEAIDFEYGVEPHEIVTAYSGLLADCGVTDIVCSPQEAAAIIEYGDQININTPGVRLPNTSKDDQARVNTPRAAFAAGVKRIICGRNIYDPKIDGDNYDVVYTNIQKIFDNIEGRD